MVNRKVLENMMKNTDWSKRSVSGNIDWNNKGQVINYITARAKMLGMPEEFIPIYINQLNQESGLMHYSNGKVKRGGSGEFGIGQIMPSTAKSLKIDPSDPVQNIDGSIKYMINALIRSKGDPREALRMYNGGFEYKDSNKAAQDQTARYADSILAASGFPTGAASPIQPTQSADIGDAMGRLAQDELTTGEKIVEKYIKDAGYDTKVYREIRDQKQKEIKETLDAIKKLPDSASPEQLQAITNKYAQAKQDLNNAYGTAIAGIQSGIGADTIDNYYNKLVNADEARLKRMQEANPYTQLSNQTQVNPIDIDKLRGQQAYNAWASRVSNALNPQAGVYNRANQEMLDRQQLQAAQLYNATGLTPEQFIERGLMDYNNMGATLNNQQQAMIRALNNQQLSDRQAQQILAEMQINKAVANNRLMQNEQLAKATADAAALERAKFAADNARWGVTQGQDLDAYALSGDAAMQRERLGQTGSIMNSSANRGTSMAGNMLDYQAMLQKAASQGAGNPTDDMKTLLDIQKPILSAAGMSQSIDALPNAISNYQKSIMQNFPQYARYVDPSAPANAYQPVQGLSGFNVTGQNTFRPQQ